MISESTPEQMWDSLVTKFEQRTDERKASLVEQITSTTQKNGDSVSSFISYVEELQRRLHGVHNETVSDSMLMGIILKGVRYNC